MMLMENSCYMGFLLLPVYKNADLKAVFICYPPLLVHVMVPIHFGGKLCRMQKIREADELWVLF